MVSIMEASGSQELQLLTLVRHLYSAGLHILPSEHQPAECLLVDPLVHWIIYCKLYLLAHNPSESDVL